MITKQDIQAAASYIFRSSFVSEDQARKVTIRAGNNATKNLVKTFRVQRKVVQEGFWKSS